MPARPSFDVYSVTPMDTSSINVPFIQTVVGYDDFYKQLRRIDNDTPRVAFNMLGHGIVLLSLAHNCWQFLFNDGTFLEINGMVNSPKEVYEIVKNYGKDITDLGEL